MALLLHYALRIGVLMNFLRFLQAVPPRCLLQLVQYSCSSSESALFIKYLGRTLDRCLGPSIQLKCPVQDPDAFLLSLPPAAEPGPPGKLNFNLSCACVRVCVRACMHAEKKCHTKIAFCTLEELLLCALL